jgi:hypothetical protein
MRFDTFINNILKEDAVTKNEVHGDADEDEISNSVNYVMKEYGLSFEEVYVMIEEYEDDPNFWDYFCSLRNEDEVNSLMSDIRPDLYEKRLKRIQVERENELKRIQDEIAKSAYKGHDFENLLNL